MDNNYLNQFDRRPKRQRDKYNPYKLLTTGVNTPDPHYYLQFTDSVHVEQFMEISKEIFEAMDRFELDDLRILHEFERHSEHSELTEQSLHDRAVNKGEPVEDAVLRQMQNEALYAAIQKLAEKQRCRVTLYYFKGYKIREIAEMEGTSQSTVSRSIQKAEINLKIFLSEG